MMLLGMFGKQKAKPHIRAHRALGRLVWTCSLRGGSILDTYQAPTPIEAYEGWAYHNQHERSHMPPRPIPARGGIGETAKTFAAYRKYRDS